jgi:hypothetical protein
LKTTLPVGVPPPVELTVAVTLYVPVPNVPDVGVATIPVADGSCFTITEAAALVEAVKSAFPEYTAV